MSSKSQLTFQIAGFSIVTIRYNVYPGLNAVIGFRNHIDGNNP